MTVPLIILALNFLNDVSHAVLKLGLAIFKFVNYLVWYPRLVRLNTRVFTCQRLLWVKVLLNLLVPSVMVLPLLVVVHVVCYLPLWIEFIICLLASLIFQSVWTSAWFAHHNACIVAIYIPDLNINSFVQSLIVGVVQGYGRRYTLIVLQGLLSLLVIDWNGTGSVGYAWVLFLRKRLLRRHLGQSLGCTYFVLTHEIPCLLAVARHIQRISEGIGWRLVYRAVNTYITKGWSVSVPSLSCLPDAALLTHL